VIAGPFVANHREVNGLEESPDSAVLERLGQRA